MVKLKKEAQKPKPWSDNDTFQSVYFCNVHREDDKVTRWIRDNYDLPPEHAQKNMVLARLVNKIESLEALGWPWVHFNGYKWEEVMSQKGAWGSAYIVSTNGRRMVKHEYIEELITDLWHEKLAPSQTKFLCHAHKRLMSIRGLGSFMAAQVVADLKHTQGHPLQKALDWWDWSSHGPGSLRGLAWVYDVPVIRPKDYHRHMNDLMPLVAEEMSWLPSIPRISAQDLQNCLCEFDKYMRVSTGVGKSKRKYDGAK